MKEGFKNALFTVLILALAVGVFLAGAYTMHFKPQWFGYDGKKLITHSSSAEGTDIQMPGEAEYSEVTVKDVKSKLEELSDFSTYSGTYTITLGKEQMRYWLKKLRIPGTTNSIEITCEGIVKVGYDFKDIKIQVDDNKIYIALPEAKVNDNYVIWDTIKCVDKNNILNPIEFSQYQELITEIEKLGLEDVEEKKIYEKAEENFKVLINGFLSEFSGYEIVYM